MSAGKKISLRSAKPQLLILEQLTLWIFVLIIMKQLRKDGYLHGIFPLFLFLNLRTAPNFTTKFSCINSNVLCFLLIFSLFFEFFLIPRFWHISWKFNSRFSQKKNFFLNSAFYCRMKVEIFTKIEIKDDIWNVIFLKNKNKEFRIYFNHY